MSLVADSPGSLSMSTSQTRPQGMAGAATPSRYWWLLTVLVALFACFLRLRLAWTAVVYFHEYFDSLIFNGIGGL